MLADSEIKFLAKGIMASLLKEVEDEREDEAMSFRAIITKHELRYSKDLKAMFRAQKREVLAKLEVLKDLTDLFMFDVTIWEANLKDISFKHMKSASSENGKRVFEDLKEIDKTFSKKDLDIQATYDMDYPEALEYLEEQSIKLAGEVTATTEAAIRAQLAQGFAEGLTINEIAENISGVFDQAERARALRIARTEMSRSANYGALSAYKQSGVVVSKEWLTAADEKVCVYCGRMDGTVHDLDTPFLSMGVLYEGIDETTMSTSYMDVQAPPLHPSCRCTLLPVIGDVTILIRTDEEDLVYEMFSNTEDADYYIKKKKEYILLMEEWGVTPTSKKLDRWFLDEYYDDNFKDTSDWMRIWQGDTNNAEAMALRIISADLEGSVKNIVWTRGKKYKDEVLANLDKYLSKEEYIKVRAFNQAYMSAIGEDSITLYRGTDGRSGKKIVKKIKKEYEDGKKAFTFKDREIAGYSSDKSVGDGWGSERDGFTIKKKVDKSDIIIHKDLLQGVTGKYTDKEKNAEFEFIIKSGGKNKVKASDINWKGKQ